MKRSKLFKGDLYLEHNIFRIEEKIDLLLEEIDLKNRITKSSIKEFNKLDCEVVIALMNAQLESTKGIQYTIMYGAFSFVILAGFIKIMLVDLIFSFFFTIIACAIAVWIMERKYKNLLLNYTYLKELLLIYKNQKFKEE